MVSVQARRQRFREAPPREVPRGESCCSPALARAIPGQQTLAGKMTAFHVSSQSQPRDRTRGLHHPPKVQDSAPVSPEDTKVHSAALGIHPWTPAAAAGRGTCMEA